MADLLGAVVWIVVSIGVLAAGYGSAWLLDWIVNRIDRRKNDG